MLARLFSTLSAQIFRAEVQDSGCHTHVIIIFQSENEYAGP